MKRILYIENTASIDAVNFYKAAAAAAARRGLEFHLAYNAYDRTDEKIAALRSLYGVHFHQVDFIRTPFHPLNIAAYRQIRELIEREKIDFIHCNTPIGGVIGRIAGTACKCEKIIYEAHGFHFYKGAPFINRMLFKWAEQIMARHTDALITMNEEDYLSALQFKLREGGRVYKVHGVGIALGDFGNIPKDGASKRSELGIADTDILCISAGNLVKSKNHAVAIEALAKTKNKKIHCLICGDGPEKNRLERLAQERGVSDRLHLPGFRTDMKELMKISDIFLFTTLREGLPRSMMEAMASGLPCIASSVRGNTELLRDGKGGYLRQPLDAKGFADCIDILAENEDLRKSMGHYNVNEIKKYGLEIVINEITAIYDEVFSLK